MGYDVSCDIGNSEFKMDIGVINPYNSEVYLLGILLDSENCKEAATARDRFVLQPSILQRLGWKLLRLWVLDWLDDPELVKRKIQALLSDERENARKVFEASQQSIKEQQPDDVQEQAAVAELEPEEDEDSDIVSTQSEIGTAVMSQAVPVPSATKPAETSAAQQPDQPVLAVVEILKWILQNMHQEKMLQQSLRKLKLRKLKLRMLILQRMQVLLKTQRLKQYRCFSD